MLQIESSVSLLQMSERSGKTVLIDVIDIIGQSNAIVINYEQAKEIINFLNNVYEKPNGGIKVEI